jgi:DNA helicase II / ATP-dependent DNA helicase PcrA
MSFKPSKYQQVVYNTVLNETCNIVVNAVAGSGKTTTILNVLKLIPNHLRILFLAFNKSIVTELKEKVGKNNMVDVVTIHSLGYSSLKEKFSNVEIDGRKYSKILTSIFSYLNNNFINKEELNFFNRISQNKEYLQYFSLTDENKEDLKNYSERILKLCDLGRLNKIDIKSGSHSFLEKIAEKHGIEILNGECQKAFYLIKIGIEITDVVDFTDMIWLPLVYKTNLTKYDLVFVDECQDLNTSQRHLMLNSIKNGTGRFIAVGDPNQAIYGFAGADINSYNELCQFPNTKQLPLSYCYRCGNKIVELAKTIVPQIESPESAIEGEILENAKITDIRDKDMILCRSVYPLVKLCLTFLSQGKKAKLIGSDISSQLSGMIKNQERIREEFTMENVVKRLEKDLEKILKKIVLNEKISESEAKNSSSYINYEEKIMVIKEISGLETDPNKIMLKINSIFSDNSTEGIILSSCHKSKGLENDRVFIIHPEKLPLVRKGMKDWEIEQEKNLQYVAYTRAKKLLGFIPIDNFDAYSDSPIINKSEENLNESNYVGEVGKKYLVSGIIVEERPIVSAYGENIVYVIKDTKGNIFEKIGKIDKKFIIDNKSEIKEGVNVEFYGTIKKHQEFKKEKRNYISTISLR